MMDLVDAGVRKHLGPLAEQLAEMFVRFAAALTGTTPPQARRRAARIESARRGSPSVAHLIKPSHRRGGWR